MGEREDTPGGGAGSGRGWMAKARSFWRCGAADPAEARPRVLWRMQRFCTLLGCAPAILFWMMGISGVQTVGGISAAAVVTGLSAVLVALAIVQGRRMYRLQAQAKSVKYRVCPECGYSLVDLDEESGTCPECGTAYTRSGLWVVWTRG